jgi:hypothetical protein
MEPMSFTVEYSGRAQSLNTNCWISPAFNPKFQPGVNPPQMHEFPALWDTGAMGSVIDGSVVKELGLKPTGNAKVFHANGEAIVNTYSISIALPNGLTFPTVRVTEGCLNGTKVLIGMDIISIGDFAVTCAGGKTKFSFQVPSTHDIDFVMKSPSKPGPVIKGSQPGRNDPCPCGSGKKYKNCHGK